MHRAGHPIEFAQFIQHRAANADARVTLEGTPRLRIKLADGMEQTDLPVAVKVLDVHMRGQGHGQAAHDRLYERHVLFDELFFSLCLLYGVSIALSTLSGPPNFWTRSRFHRDEELTTVTWMNRF